MKQILITTIMVIAISIPALAKELSCSTRLANDTPDSALSGLAKISQAAAKKIALADIKAKSKKLLDGELEVEYGCLLYSFDIRVSGESGLEEIMVDAGTGKILSHQHESPKQESAEQVEDAKAAKKP